MPIIELTNSGIKALTRNEILDDLISQFKAIYGQNVYLGEGTIDYNILSLLADVFNDMGNVAISASQALNLQTATGSQLDNLSTIFYNTITRQSATHSTVGVVITGSPNTTIVNGQVQDSLGGIWNLPTPITIPSSGEISVTATYSQTGPYLINANSINGFKSIVTTVAGWTNVNNPQASTVGQDVETDAHYRYRLAVKAQGSSKAIANSLSTNLLANSNITAVMIWENDTSGTSQAQGGSTANIPDFTEWGLYSVPSHSIVVAVYGDFANVSDDTIGQIIYLNKSTGVGTFAPSGGTGSTTVQIANAFGVEQPISFVKAQVEQVNCNIKLQPISTSSPTAISDELKTAISDAVESQINEKNIGSHLYASNLYATVAQVITDTVGANLYNISNIDFGTGVTDIQMLYNQKPIAQTITISQ